MEFIGRDILQFPYDNLSHIGFRSHFFKIVDKGGFSFKWSGFIKDRAVVCTEDHL